MKVSERGQRRLHKYICEGRGKGESGHWAVWAWYSHLWLITKMYACRAHSPINPHYGRASLWVTTRTLSNAVLGVWVQLLHEVKRSLGQVIKIFQLSPSTATTTRVASSISHTSHTSIKSLYEDANSSALNASTPSPSANPRPNCFMMLQIMIMNTIWTLTLDTLQASQLANLSAKGDTLSDLMLLFSNRSAAPPSSLVPFLAHYIAAPR